MTVTIPAAAVAIPPSRRTPPSLRALAYWTYTAVKTWRLAFAANVANPVLYLAAMGLGLGSLVDAAHASHPAAPPPAGLGTHGYLSFLAPGLLAATVLQSAVAEATYPVLGGFKWNRTYDAMLATPLSVTDVLRGHLAFIVGRTSAVGAIFLAVMTAFGTVHSPLGLLCLPVIAVLATGSAALTAALAATVVHEAWFPVVFRLVVVPLFLFSGTFVPLQQLPAWVHPVAYATPLWHAVELTRGACAGQLGLAASLGHAAYLLVLAGAGYLLVRRAFLRKLSS